MKTTFIISLLTTLFTFNAMAANDVVIIEEGNPIYKNCLSDDYQAPGTTKFKAICTSEYYFPDDDMGDSPDPIEQRFTLLSNDSVCDLYRYGANIMWLPEWDANPVDPRLAITVTDSLDPENDKPTSNSTSVVDPTTTLPVTVIVRSKKAAARHLNCTFEKVN